MTTNAKQIVKWTEENYPHVYKDFLRNPENYTGHLLNEAANWLSSRGQLYAHASVERWKAAMINQIKEWGITQLDSTQPEESDSKKLSSPSTVEAD